MARQAMFAGLVYDENENVVATAVVGPEAFYVIDDNGFKRHIDAEEVDRQVLSFFLEQLEDNKDIAVEQMLNMMGKDDLFTKAAVDASLRNHRPGRPRTGSQYAGDARLPHHDQPARRSHQTGSAVCS